MVRSFYCHHCGEKVSRSASRCPSCGRTFGAVLCPKCGFSGDSGLFAHGCPACGYLEEKSSKESYDVTEKKKSWWPQFSPLFYLIGIVILSSLIVFFITLL